jgi:hypothetical protein
VKLWAPKAPFPTINFEHHLIIHVRVCFLLDQYVNFVLPFDINFGPFLSFSSLYIIFSVQHVDPPPSPSSCVHIGAPYGDSFGSSQQALPTPRRGSSNFPSLPAEPTHCQKHTCDGPRGNRRILRYVRTTGFLKFFVLLS